MVVVGGRFFRDLEERIDRGGGKKGKALRKPGSAGFRCGMQVKRGS